MRTFVLAILLGCSAPAFAALPSWVIPSPITIAVQIGKWIYKPSTKDEVYYIRVQSKGATESQARDEAFKLAVDQAVGSLLVSESEIQKGDLQRHDVINYSSGYVDDFEYVNIHRAPGEVTLQIDVYVRKSMIANRIAINEKDSGALQGGRIAEVFKSMQTEQKSGDSVIKAVLSDFPNKAFDIQIINVEYAMPNRQPVLFVNYSVTWHKKYIHAFKEALRATMTQTVGKNQLPNTLIFKKACVFCTGYEQYQTQDVERLKVLYDGLTSYNKKPMLLIEVLDTHQKPLHRFCERMHNNLLIDSSLTIVEDGVTKQKIRLNLSGLDVSNFDTVDLTPVTLDQCNL
jgi:hypothetical protein